MNYKVNYKVDNGIKIFSEENFYWFADLSREKLKLLTEELRNKDLIEACRALDINPSYLAGYHRADFIYFLPYKEGGLKILDLGSGFGNITIPLSKRMPNAEIIAADASLDILNFLKVRAEQEGCNNIDFCKIGILEEFNLPFQANSFDIILMNGVLEWIGSGIKEGDPRKIQIKFLKYIKNFLKEDGVLYIGIEGRFFIGHFVNIPDPHSRLKYTSIVPRIIADQICKLKGKPGGYRTYTYSFYGYKKLFKESGFDLRLLETIYPVANYKDPFFLFSYNEKTAYRLAFNYLRKIIFPTKKSSFIYWFLYKLNLEKLFAPSYLFLLGQNKSRLLNYYLREFLGEKINQYEIIKFFSNLSDNGFIAFWLINKNNKKIEYLFKIKRTDRDKKEILFKFRKLKELNLEEFILPVEFNDVCCLYKYVENYNFLFNENILAEAVKLIRKMHEKTRSNIYKKLRDNLDLNYGFCHGDYTLENIIKTRNGLKIVDFDDAELNGLQIFDIYSLLIHYFIFVEKVKSEDLTKKILSEESLRYFKIYNGKITPPDLKVIFRMYTDSQIEKFRNLRNSHFVLFSKIKEDLDII